MSQDVGFELGASLVARGNRKRDSNVEKIYSRRAVEQAFLETFELVGGVPRLALWANEPENYGKFVELILKLAPKESARELDSMVIEYRSLVPSSALNNSDVSDGEIIIDSH